MAPHDTSSRNIGSDATSGHNLGTATRARDRKFVRAVPLQAPRSLVFAQATGRGQRRRRGRGLAHGVHFAGAARSRSGLRHSPTCVMRLRTRCRCHHAATPRGMHGQPRHDG